MAHVCELLADDQCSFKQFSVSRAHVLLAPSTVIDRKAPDAYLQLGDFWSCDRCGGQLQQPHEPNAQHLEALRGSVGGGRKGLG